MGLDRRNGVVNAFRGFIASEGCVRGTEPSQEGCGFVLATGCTFAQPCTFICRSCCIQQCQGIDGFFGFPRSKPSDCLTVAGVGCSNRITRAISGRNRFGEGGDRCIEVTRIVQCCGECTEKISLDGVIDIGFASCAHVASSCQCTPQDIGCFFGLPGVDESGCQSRCCHDDGALLPECFESVKRLTQGDQCIVFSAQAHQCCPQHLAYPGGQCRIVITVAQKKECFAHGLVVAALIDKQRCLLIARLESLGGGRLGVAGHPLRGG